MVDNLNTIPKINRNRVMIKNAILHYSSVDRGYIKVGETWTECWWDASTGWWREWCGNYSTTSTADPITPLAWAPVSLLEDWSAK